MKNYTYYIYLIEGKKIGATCDLEKRMNDQGFTHWEILWQAEGDWDFGWIVGEKEQELQKLYGYPVDKSNYQISRMNRPKFDGSQRTYELTNQNRSKGGKIQGKKNVESGHLASIASLGGSAKSELKTKQRSEMGKKYYSHAAKVAGSKIHECPVCGRKIKSNGGFNSHMRTHKNT